MTLAAAETLTFGMVYPLGGPDKELERGMKTGIEIAFAAVNEAGGVHGRKLALVALDDGNEPSRTAEGIRGEARLLPHGPPGIAQGVGSCARRSGCLASSRPRVKQAAGIATLCVISGPARWLNRDSCPGRFSGSPVHVTVLNWRPSRPVIRMFPTRS